MYQNDELERKVYYPQPETLQTCWVYSSLPVGQSDANLVTLQKTNNILKSQQTILEYISMVIPIPSSVLKIPTQPSRLLAVLHLDMSTVTEWLPAGQQVG